MPILGWVVYFLETNSRAQIHLVNLHEKKKIKTMKTKKKKKKTTKKIKKKDKED